MADPEHTMPPPDRSRATPLVALLLVLVALAVVVLGVLLFDGDDDDQTGQATGTTLDDEPSEPRTSPPERSVAESSKPDLSRPGSTESSAPEPSPPGPSEAAGLPEAMVGSWTGTVTQQSTSTTYTVEMTLSASPDADGRIGTVTYPTLDCSGYYTLDAVQDDGIVLVEHITDGLANCVDGVGINLSPVDQDHLRYTFAYQGNPEDGVATLTRTR